MDRQIVYPGQILPETSLLQMAKDAMIGVAKLSAAMLGTSTTANGFAVTPTGPASLQVVCAPGEIYSLTSIDALAFSTLPADTTHSIMKQGILLDGVTLNCPAPGTTGQSINYLVQATYQDSDSAPVLLPYYNSANPALPYTGMGNNGLTQNTNRKGIAVVAVKAGASAVTGSQVTPAPDAGFIGLYVVTVAFGQTTITGASISQYSGAPLLPAGLLQSVQSGQTTSAPDIGVANAYAANFTPAITALSDKMVLCIKAVNANTTASTFTPAPGVIAPSPIVGGAHVALQGGEIVPNGDCWFQWNSSVGAGSWILIDGTGGAVQVPKGTKSSQAVNQSQLGNLNGITFASGSTTLNATFAGKALVVNSAGTTQTLPAAASLLSGSAIVIAAYGACTVKGNAAELITNQLSVSANTFLMNAGEQLQLTTDGTGWYVSAYSQAIVGTPVGSMRNAKMSVAAASATATFTADEVCVKAALGGQSWLLSSFSKTINLATTGAGGMDTGTAPVSGFVSLYAIYNPATGGSALLACAQATSNGSVYTGANMPAGYTASALISTWPTNASSQFVVGYQLDRKIYIDPFQVISSSTQQASLVSLSVALAVPTNAKTVDLLQSGTVSSSGFAFFAAGDSTGIGQRNYTVNSTGVQGVSVNDIPLITTQTIYYKITTSGTLTAFTLNVTSYTF
ncbi:hypothetical protein [Pseudomonas sp. LB3P58]